MKIEMGKQYKTRGGYPVQILCVDGPHEDYPVVAILDNAVLAFTIDGHYSSGTPSARDLIEISPYEDFKIDDKVMVRDCVGDDWEKRYFAGVTCDGCASAYDSGYTSWTSKVVIEWRFCRKPTAEELA